MPEMEQMIKVRLDSGDAIPLIDLAEYWSAGHLAEMIKQEDGKWVLYSMDGSKVLGTFDTEEEAKAREKEVKALKHMPAEEQEIEAPPLSEEAVAEDDKGAVLMIGEGEVNGYSGPVVMDVALIEPGFGNAKDNHYYPKETLVRAAPKFAGIKMYTTNHVDGEHTVRNEVAEILKCPVRFTDSGAPVARVGVFDAAFAENVRNRAKLGTLTNLQCSILGSGKVKRDSVDEGGRKGHLVEDIMDIKSVDWVPRAGAGGRVLNLVEMEGSAMTETVTEVEKDKEGQKTETVIEAIHEQEKPQALDSAAVLPILMEAGLPNKTVARLANRQYFKVEDVQAAVAEVKEVLAEIQEAGRPRNMGDSTEVPKPTKKPAEVAEAERDILRKHGLLPAARG